jgi:predicted metalloprotease with PDZ domain
MAAARQSGVMRNILAFASLATSTLALTFASPALAQAGAPGNSAPTAVAISPSIPEARDVPFPGTIAIDIDATDVERGIYRVKQAVPVPQGSTSLILQLPQWLPGNHAPRGPMNLIADLRFSVNGRAVAWRRDPVEVNAFHLTLPSGARMVDVSFVHTSPLQSSEGRITMTREMLNLQWEKMTLYPAGHYVRQVKVKPTVTFPEGWAVHVALDGMRAQRGKVTWDVVDYETLVDSPVFAGKYSRTFDLGHDVELNTVADAPEQLELKPENLATFRKMVDEALAVFGTKSFDRYHFLLAMTDRMGGIGLEHHRSSENQYSPTTLIEWDKMAHDRNVIPHELVHSWNGKFRRPARLWTPDYRQPMQDNLLWMYEGQTQFWGWILAARSNLQGKDIVLGALAASAGNYSEQPGRAWRPVEDTTHDPIVNARRPVPFSSISRSEDYYSEGMLVWLEADQIIRQGTSGARGLDDFARAFFGLKDGDWGQVTYEFEDIVNTLNAVHPYDWTQFLTDRFRTAGQPAPVRGIEMAGYKLVWKEEPNPYDKLRFAQSGAVNLYHSLGISLNKEGRVTATMWDGPAFDAGIVNGAQVMAVNGEEFSGDRLRAAVTAAKTGDPVTLLIKRGSSFTSVTVPYKGGLRYPWLERTGEAETGLDRLLAAKTGG